mmetsp:Transcript_20193/g.61281  ORF Transcript_20193/g.61281 Transcript_20193/m.61281 type:complete len:546 (-) Transcript_20193:743-2380(-)
MAAVTPRSRWASESEVRRLGLVGRRTGVTVRSDIRRDSQGFEDLEEFWGIKTFGSGGSAAVAKKKSLSPLRGLDSPEPSAAAVETYDGDDAIVDDGAYDSAEGAEDDLGAATHPSPSPSPSPEKVPSALKSRRSNRALRFDGSPGKRKKNSVRFEDTADDTLADMPPPDDYYDDAPVQDDGEDTEEESPSPLRRAKSRAKPKPKPRAKPKPKATPKAKKPPARRRRAADEPAEEDDDEFKDLPPDERETGGLRKVQLMSPDLKDQTPGARRSKRRRLAPLAYWKNERFIYDREFDSQLPTVAARTQAPAKTPASYKRRATVAKRKAPKRGAAKKKGKAEDDDDEDDDETDTELSSIAKKPKPLPRSALPRRYTYRDDGWALVWDEETVSATEKRIVTYSRSLQQTELPITAVRPRNKQGVGLAAQAFNTPEVAGHMPGWISGQVVLPPQAIKDAEGVGACAQVFVVASAQPDSLELDIASPEETGFDPASAQRFILGPGDHFVVPPNNIYRLENHSKDAEAIVCWTIIKPLGVDNADLDDDEASR